jgi:DNA-binding transcriptional LysR family regulator
MHSPTECPPCWAGFDQALREVRSAASRAARVLRVGFLAGAANEATQQIIAAFARRWPGWRVEMRAASWTDPTAGLASGDTDVALLRLPFPGQDSLRVEVLFTEPRWVALPAAHLLAGCEYICFSDLWDEPFVAAPAETGWWRDWWLAADEREGHPVRIGAVTETGQPDDWLTAIANGDGIALAPESAARYYARPGITYRPVTGVSPSQVGVAWPPAADTNSVTQDFIRCCLDNKPPRRPKTSRPLGISRPHPPARGRCVISVVCRAGDGFGESGRGTRRFGGVSAGLEPDGGDL